MRRSVVLALFVALIVLVFAPIAAAKPITGEAAIRE